ncbi:MAG TPA: metal-dependent hydrolase [Flavobacteriales bacterium]|nr:metal-dependent hydrolase [Flavobacteriales bacterium]
MDSVTQIVLGAAVGEVVLGRKIGNKAMLWGAIAGTIPDLDVLSRWLFDDLRANELHRGVTHSILFSLVMAPLLGWWVKKHRRSLLAVFILLIGLVFIHGAGSMNVWLLIMAVTAVAIALVLWKGNRSDEVSVKEWSWLFWWSLVTHPLLDCHTTWGTQLFWPLPWKVAYNNIFVVDPLYTVPFLIFVAIAMFFNRADPRRRTLNWIGICISTVYMALTLVFKYIAFEQVEHSVERQGIPYSDISTRPTPFNAILWTANVNSQDAYRLGYYSLLDKKPDVDLVVIPKNHALLGKWLDNDKVQRLIQLSDDNYVIKLKDDTLLFCDLRFGQLGEPGADKPFVYSYKLIPEGNDLRVELLPPPAIDGDGFKDLMNGLWQRLKGV